MLQPNDTVCQTKSKLLQQRSATRTHLSRGVRSVLTEGLSRSAKLLVKGSGPAPSQTRNLNDLEPIPITSYEDASGCQGAVVGC